ncbi:unnamed protein product [Phyllotreta striolata]|uniref:Peptidase S1 domain-containing protein n=1 Tax=Phyllotreta striolata TaxID=444603 RepID=A0A9N9TNT6_PHYSR|nr:unnamed protein product [Phyllotreta striolata]
MRYKIASVTFLACFLVYLCDGVRIPPNPCEHIFRYYKDKNGRIYGEATIPYDNATSMTFGVNASLAGRFNKADLKLKLVTTVKQLNDFAPFVVYNIFFPFQDTIPKITGITYNRRSYCSGPPEPLIAGTPGVTSVWHQLYFEFTRVFNRQDTNPERTDDGLASKEPGVPDFVPWREPTTSSTTTTTESPFQFHNQHLVPPRNDTYYTPEPPIRQPTPQTPLQQTPVSPTPQTGPEKVPIDIDFIQSLFTPSPPTTSAKKCGMTMNQPTGNSIVPLIYNGEFAEIGDFPWLVAFMEKRNSTFEYTCSGNLITEKHVITAARCIMFYGVQIVKNEDIMLVMGTNNLLNWRSSKAVHRKVVNSVAHPSFQDYPDSAHGDIAVLTMDRTVRFTNALSPICLWSSSTNIDEYTKETGVVAGYGQDEDARRNGQLHAVRLKRANMPIISQRECYNSPVGFDSVVSDMTFCTKSGETATGPCIGDSGAGFFVKLGGVYYLRGIASIISSENGTCDLSNQYIVFCDVAKFVNWIKNEIET